VQHGFTHFELELGLAIYAGEAFGALDGGEWWPVEDIESAGLPTLFAKAAALAAEAPPLADPGGGELGQLATAIVEMLRLAPTTEMGNPLAELIGPCWSTQQVERATGTTRQNLSDLARRDRAIRLRTADGTYWWPTFQFRRVGGVARFDVGSQRLWQVLPHGTFDDWDLAAWMLRPRHDLNGRRPVDLAVTEDAVEQSPLVDAIDDLVMRAER
jgi:hypothetical protein